MCYNTAVMLQRLELVMWSEGQWEALEEKDDWMNELMNYWMSDGDVCRTAPATTVCYSFSPIKVITIWISTLKHLNSKRDTSQYVNVHTDI